MSTHFDSLSGVVYSDLVSKPSETTMVYTVVVTSFSTKIMRRVEKQRTTLENLFKKPVNVAVFPKADLTQVQTLSSTPRPKSVGQGRDELVDFGEYTTNIRKAVDLAVRDTYKITASTTYGTVVEPNPGTESPQFNWSPPRSAQELDQIETPSRDNDIRPSCDDSGCFGCDGCCDDCYNGDHHCCHDCG